jgi:hypothetical protein
MGTEGHMQAKPTQTAQSVSHVGIPGWGVDRRREDRPGVPKEAPPHPLPGAHWQEPERQIPMLPVLKHALLEEPTPVFSSAQPPRGLSGALRRVAYSVPDHRAGHWVILRIADRIDIVEGNLGQRFQWLPAAAALLLDGTRRAQARRQRA